MIERILVPLDGSTTAEAILPHLKRLLRRSDSEVIVMRAANPPPAEDAMALFEASLAAAREYVVGMKERLESQGVRAKAVARLGSPAGAILDTAEEEKATLIAMATHGRTGLARAFLGSVAEHVLRKSPVPVVVVRPFWSYEIGEKAEEKGVKSILLPLDGSETALRAIPEAVEFAKLFQARLVLYRVVEPEGRGKETPLSIVREEVEEAAAKVRKAGVEAGVVADRGEPVAEILKAARFHGADLIAMATHGRTGLSRLFGGSVTERILREAEVPMLIVRARKPAKAKVRARR
jgi:nucleotide-binding universal stress UspA family protein